MPALTDSITPMTGYARLSPWQARVVLGLIVLVAGAGVAVTLSPLSSSNLGPHPNEAGDVALYRAEVARIRHGERYYQAAAAELTARGYPTRSVFNWRTPLPVWLLGKLPAVVLGKALPGGLALALLLMAFEAVSSNNSRGLTAPGRIAPGRTVGITPIGCALLLTGPLLPTVLGDLFMMPVLWAGVLIGLSACAFRNQSTAAWRGVGLGGRFLPRIGPAVLHSVRRDRLVAGEAARSYDVDARPGGVAGLLWLALVAGA